jgi:hypothetical protein
MTDPFTSPQTRKEREAHAAKIRKVAWAAGGGLAVVVIAVVLVFSGVFASGSSASKGGNKVSPDVADTQELTSLDELIANGNAILSDPAAKAADKAKWQKDRAEMEKKRKEILARHPDWKKN